MQESSVIERIPARVATPEAKTVPVLDVASQIWSIDEAVAALDRAGCIVLRNLLPPDRFAELARRVETVLARPAIAGSIGYAKIDHPKKLANPFLLRRPFVDLALDERVIDLVERYQGSETILAEANLKHDAPVGYVYFPMHADFSVGWRKKNDSPFRLSAEDMRQPIGVGGAFYLHDTREGAFCFCVGSHQLLAPRGKRLNAYPEGERRAILDSLVRVDGKAGDLVLFDDRGFHGPDQPAPVSRTVILLDYYRVATFGHTQVAPLLAYPSDLGGLSPRQLRVLGVGAGEMVAPEDYLLTQFKRSRHFGRAQRLIERAYVNVHRRQRVKKLLGPRIVRWLRPRPPSEGYDDV